MIERIKNSNQIKLLISHNVFYFGRSFLDIFVNIIIWNQTEDLLLVALFNIFRLASHVLSFFFFGNVVKRSNNRSIKNIGLAGYALTILLLGFFKEFFLVNTYLMGILLGTFNGMYWINYHTIQFDLTNKTNRAKYVGWENSLRIIIGLFVPVVGGAMLAYLPENQGYYALLVSSIALVISAIFLGNFKTKKSTTTTHTEYFNTFQMIFKDSDLRRTLFSIMLGGFVRRGAFFFYINPTFYLSCC